MSFIIQGPHPLFRTTLLLPSPEVANSEGLRSSVQTIRAMDGTLYTYVKPKRGRRIHTWDFIASRDKGKEAKEFARQYAGGLVQVVDHENVSRIGYIVINPYQFLGEGRAYPWGELHEAVRFTIEFEEEV